MLVGLDRLIREGSPTLDRLRGAKVGLLAHPASVAGDLTHIGAALEGLGVRPVIFFGPEHGYGGEAQDMIGVTSAVDPRSGAPIISLYGAELDDLIPKDEHLRGLDVLVIDLADVGSRYYTFVWTALLTLRRAAKHGVHVLILDRPNPIGGSPDAMEGRVQEPGFLSFVGLEPVPIRHSLTIGEIVARQAAREGLALGEGGALSVLGVTGWDREAEAGAWDRDFVMPSPNMPTVDTALVYPGGCLIEGTNLSEGRGTTRPFEIVGAPFIDGERLARDLAKLALPGAVARPLSFQPTFHKHAGKRCGGVQVHITDRRAFEPVKTYVALVALAHAQAPEAFAFRTERYEYVDTIPAFDLLTGSARCREAILAGDDPRAIAERAAWVDPAWRGEHDHAKACRERASVGSPA